MPSGSTWRERSLVALLLGALIAAVHVPSLPREFVNWDDPLTIAHNPRLAEPGEALRHYWRHAEGGLYIPVTYTWWLGLDRLAAAGGAERGSARHALPHHLGNIALHWAFAVAAYALIRRLVPASAAIAGAVIVALHPIQVESVAWASGAKDLLAATGAVLALLAHHASWDAPARARRAVLRIASTGVLLLAVLAKPSAVVVPLLALLLDRHARRPWRASLRAAAALWVVAAVATIWARVAQDAYPHASGPLWSRPLIALDAIAFYLGKIALPIDLTIVYGRTPQQVIDSGAIWWTPLVPVALTALLWRRRSDVPVLWTAWCGFAGALLPTLGLAAFTFQIYSTTADHYAYLAMAFVGLGVAGALARQRRRVAWATTAALAVGLALASAGQLRAWKDAVSLARHASRLRPDNVNLLSMHAKAQAQKQRYDEALPLFREVVRRRPDVAEGLLDLMMAELVEQRWDEALRLAGEVSRLAAEGRASPQEESRAATHAALIGLAMGDPDVAERAMDRMDALDPSRPAPAEWRERARDLRQQTKGPSKDGASDGP